MEAVIIGHTSIDRIRINGNEKIQLGGAAIYSGMASKIFSKTGIVSRIGSDFPAEFLSILRKCGIDTAGLKKIKGKSTRFSIEYDTKGYAKYSDYSISVGMHIRPGDVPKSYFNAKIFHLAPMAASKQKKFIDFIRKKTDSIISMNTHVGYFSKYKKEIQNLMSNVDIFTLNDEEAMRLTNTKSLEHALTSLKKMKHNLVTVTMGVYGCIVIEEEINFFPSLYQEKIVDLTGCGDAFAGSFASSFIKTRSALKSANIANSVASIAATDWNFKAIKNLKFRSLENFQEFVVSRQRKQSKNQQLLDNFL